MHARRWQAKDRHDVQWHPDFVPVGVEYVAIDGLRSGVTYGVRVAAVNTQAAPMVAQGLGVKMLPTIKWFQPIGEKLAVADYQGGRDAASIVRFAEAAGTAIKEQAAGAIKDASKEATAAADAKAAAGSKIGMSKVGKSKADGPDAESKIGESKAKESEVAAEAKGPEKAAEEAAKPAAEAVQKAETPAAVPA